VSPTPSPTAPPTKRPRPKTPEDVLVRNPLYGLDLAPSDCSQPPRPLPTSKSGDERYLNNLIGCMAAAYGPPLKAAGYRLTRPALLIYTGTVATPCGQALKGYPVFYCGSNETVYSSAGSTAEYGSTLRLGGYWIVFHEFGHHVQQRIGVLDAAYTRNEDDRQISRRIELQADCFMGMTSISVRSTRLTAADRDELTNWREQVPDKIHGTSASQLYWVRRGFGTNAFARCSTWSGTKHLS
jgi:predicted metalloprotease